MIMVGKNIASVADKMVKVKEDYLYQQLRHPKSEIENLVNQLRIIYTLDPKMYGAQKRALPYFVCGTFTPEFRKKENFAYTESFLVDLDHLSAKKMNLEDLRLQLCKDSRVFMCFASPSEDGLKVMFKLKERCFDAGLYSIFYKQFIVKFATQYGLEQVVDQVTSDVSRACFVSIDKHAYYNPDCEPVDLNLYVDTTDPFSLFGEKKKTEKELKEWTEEQKKGTEKKTDPEKAVMDQIKETLKLKSSPKEKKSVYVPQELNDIVGDLKAYIDATGITTTEIISIQYGKKMRFKLGLKQAEINLFYGKRGYSVVISPRCGTDEEMNKLVADLVQNFIDTYDGQI
ncbi:MAG: virulence protein E [Paludibacteraceae bacterium]|nr:virulence protein E [Paludibacteraceae bacterium]